MKCSLGFLFCIAAALAFSCTSQDSEDSGDTDTDTDADTDSDSDIDSDTDTDTDTDTERPCRVAHGNGIQTKNDDPSWPYWNTCQASGCDSGYSLVGNFCLDDSGRLWNTPVLLDIGTPNDVSGSRGNAFGVYDPYADMTAVVYMGPGNAAYSAYMDHQGGSWSAPIFVGNGQSTSKYSYPKIVQTPDGYFHIFFVSHTTFLWYARSTLPHDPSSWDFQGELSVPDVVDDYGVDPSYPNPMVSTDGRIYVFYRQMLAEVDTANRQEYVTYSDDSGSTWSIAAPVILAALHTTCDGGTILREVYGGGMTQEPPRLGAAQKWHYAWSVAGGNEPGGHNNCRENGYYAAYRPDEDAWYSAAGANLGETIDQGEMTAECLYEINPNAGYGDTTFPDGEGVPKIGNSWRWGGSDWEELTVTGLGESRWQEWYRGRYISYAEGNVNESYDSGESWVSVAGSSINPDLGHAKALPFPAHPAARVWLKEQQNGEVNDVYMMGHQSSMTPQQLLVTIGDLAQRDTEIPLRAFITDEHNARLSDAQGLVTFSVYGNGTIVGDSQVDASNGMARTTLQIGSGEGRVIVVASSSGLQDGFIQFHVR